MAGTFTGPVLSGHSLILIVGSSVGYGGCRPDVGSAKFWFIVEGFGAVVEVLDVTFFSFSVMIDKPNFFPAFFKFEILLVIKMTQNLTIRFGNLTLNLHI